MVPYATYFAWRYHYFGFMLPNTFYAKTGLTFWIILRGLKYLGLFILCYALIVLVPIARWVAYRPEKGAETRRTTVAFAGALLLVYGLYIVFIGGDYMAMFRFFVPMLPFLYLIATAALWAPESTPGSGRSLVSILLLALAIAVTSFWSTPLESRLPQFPEIYHGNYSGVQKERWHVARLTLVGKVLRSFSHDERESIVTDAIGAISYYSGLRVYDIHGMVDTHIAHEKFRDMGKYLAGHDKEDVEYQLARKPTYIVLDRALRTVSPGDDRRYGARGYRQVAVFLNDIANRECGYLFFWRRR